MDLGLKIPCSTWHQHTFNVLELWEEIKYVQSVFLLRVVTHSIKKKKIQTPTWISQTTDLQGSLKSEGVQLHFLWVQVYTFNSANSRCGSVYVYMVKSISAAQVWLLSVLQDRNVTLADQIFMETACICDTLQ